ncbi:heterokaryon incompatibility protein-domain-containing protein [Podospora conica]|nr:heterokaryon incompatibility protein-domain-containing protein [Schizothecium conicum]
MWLIDAATLRLEYFAIPEKAPAFAILSHTWGDDELSFAQFQSLRDTDPLKNTRGYEKIRKTCELALQSDIPYAWVDTCCIDKSSSAELSEAINSMFDYYQRSEICYAYLSDWEPDISWESLAPLGGWPQPEPNLRPEKESRAEPKSSATQPQPSLEPQPMSAAQPTSGSQAHPTADPSQMREPGSASGDPESSLVEECSARQDLPLRWFTRGWTLQEVIAPRVVEFFDASWQSRGFKHYETVRQHLSRITGIASKVIYNGSVEIVNTICLGQRMSWAAYRETSRLEDTAYCLIGIFQIHMPLLYGEGDKAFLRFQQEIVRHTTDLSIFAWDGDSGRYFSNIFAPHPRQFAGLGTCTRSNYDIFTERPSEILNTNQGLRVFTTPYWMKAPSDTGSILFDLQCTLGDKTAKHIFVQLHSLSKGVYSRIRRQLRHDIDLDYLQKGQTEAFYIRDPKSRGDDGLNFYQHAFRLGESVVYQEQPTRPVRYYLQQVATWPLSLSTTRLPDTTFTDASHFILRRHTGCVGGVVWFLKLSIVAQEGNPGQATPEVIDEVDLVYAWRNKKDLGSFTTYFGLLQKESVDGLLNLKHLAEQAHPKRAQLMLWQHVLMLEKKGRLPQTYNIWDSARNNHMCLDVEVGKPRACMCITLRQRVPDLPGQGAPDSTLLQPQNALEQSQEAGLEPTVSLGE